MFKAFLLFNALSKKRSDASEKSKQRFDGSKHFVKSVAQNIMNKRIQTNMASNIM